MARRGRGRKAYNGRDVSKAEGAAAAGEPSGPVVESRRSRVRKIIDDFNLSSDEVYSFEPGLNKADRVVIHMLCRSMGLISKSTGKKSNRLLSIYKREGPAKRKGVKDSNGNQNRTLKLSEETKCILLDLFTKYPPDDAELTRKSINDRSRKSAKGWNKDNSFCRPVMSNAEILKKIEELAFRKNKDPKLKEVAKDTSKLPIASFRDEISSALVANQVVLISGETGCGKTTQVPQYILDYMWGKGEPCKIVCTQPRRISAISVAERISYERGELIGNTIGYKIRLEAKGGKQSSIMFCTNGVLLRMLVSRGTDSPNASSVKSSRDCLREITHIIVDEIHERDRFSDFILAILRDILASYPHLRLLLMSATMDAERFSQYFNCCPIICVPGFTYPVKSFYLEDMITLLIPSNSTNFESSSHDETEEGMVLCEDYKLSLDEAIDLALSNEEIDPLLELVLSKPSPGICDYQHSSSGVTPLMVLAGKGRVGEVCMLLSCGASCSLKANDGSMVLDWAKKENQTQVVEIIEEHIKKDQSKTVSNQELIDRYLATINPENIDIVLIERLLRKICQESNEGAILVFLPGWDDINQTKERLLSSPFFSDSSRFLLLPLHSMIPSSEQKKVFRRPPSNMRKIILSTNIAETAVTIDDVIYVIDCGRMKEKNYDPYSNVSTLFSSWISKANAKQREGRAGRCQPGVCYHLYSKVRAASLADYQVPEIQRMPIEELCLQVKMLDPDSKIADFLQKTLDPPVLQTINNAVVVLQNIGALTSDENLTDLGEKLGALPVHPATSKMLFFAILMNCLDPALTLACAADYRDPFVLPMSPGERKKAAEAKLELASLYGGYSDHLTIIAAFDCWRHAKERGQERQFCSKYYVAAGTMNMLLAMRQQLQNELVKSGFIPKDASGCSLNARDPGILRAVLVAGAYPLIGKLLPPENKHRRTFVETSTGAKVTLSSRAINLKSSSNVKGLLLIYDEITRSEGRSFIKCCSVVGPLPLLLVSTEMFVAPPGVYEESDSDDEAFAADEDEICAPKSVKGEREIMASPENDVSLIIDGWLNFDSTALDAAQIYCLRERLFAAILFLVQYPREALPPALGASMQAIASVLSSEGLSGVSPPLNPAGPVLSGLGGRRLDGHDAGSMLSGFLRSLIGEEWYDMPHSGMSRQLAPKSPSVGIYKPPHARASQQGAPRGKHLKRRRGSGW